MKKNWKLWIFTSSIILLPILAGLILWEQLPDKIPTHWDMTGEIDGWSSKPFAVFGLPLILLAAQGIVLFTTSADPKRQNHTKKIIHATYWIIPLLSTVLCPIIYLAAMGKQVHIEIILPLLIGLILVIVGIYLPKCRQNYTIGIKLPWTLDSEENWNKTHRLSGWIWIGGGLIIMPLGFFGFLWLIFPIALIMALVPTVYSYILHRKGI